MHFKSLGFKSCKQHKRKKTKMLSQFLEKQIPEMKKYLKEDHAGSECQL